MGSLYWTYERTKCEAEKYGTIKDFRKNSPSAYNAAKAHGWMDDFTHFRIIHKRFPYTYDECVEIARNCKTRKELRKINSSVYNAIKNNGWQDIYEKVGIERLTSDHSYEECYNAAKTCSSQSEFSKKFGALYSFATKRKWLKDYTWFKSYKEICEDKVKIFTFEECYNIAKIYKNQRALIKNRRDIWRCIIVSGWKDRIDFWVTIKVPNRHLTYEMCYEMASKCNSKKEFRLADKSMYSKAFKMGWLKDYTWFRNIERDIYGEIYSIYRYYFKDYNAIYVGLTMCRAHRDWNHIFGKSSVNEFATEHNVSIPKMKILISGLTREQAQKAEDDFVKFYKSMNMNVLNKGKTGVNIGSLGGFSRKYTKKYCYDTARKCEYIGEFKKKYPYVYDHARKHGYLKEYTWLKRKHMQWTYEILMDLTKNYKTRREFEKNNSAPYKAMVRRDMVKDITWWENESI